jgi:molybdopterin-guanine dinucleotide biosynthesis protein MobB
MMARLACFIGWSNTGKTGFMEACAQELSGRGIPVATIKAVHHRAGLNPPGKDTSRCFAAGAEAALVSETETILSIVTPAAWDQPGQTADYLARLFPAARVVLVEGRVLAGAIRILVGGPASDESGLKRPLADFDVLVTNQPGLAARATGQGLKVFAPDGFRDFLDSCILDSCILNAPEGATGGNMAGREVKITISGKELPLNPFASAMVESVVLGLLQPMKNADSDGEIAITIGKTPAAPKKP